MRSPVLLFGLLVACGGNHGGDASPDAAGGTCDPACEPGYHCAANQTCVPEGECAVNEDCGAGMVCNSAHTCELGGCGGTELDLTYVAPNFMIALDRSCSMRKVLTGTTTSKWAAAVAALQHVLASHPDEIRWGLTLFPDTTGDACTQDAAAFAIGPSNAAPISMLLGDALATTDPLYPDGPCVTNIDTGIETAALDPGLADPLHTGFVMLISDGAQAGCTVGGGDSGTTAAITDLFTNRGIKTFVVGFGSQVDAAQLNQFATAGGAALPGATKYYQADTAAQLDSVFQTIANLAVSCDYVIDPPPADLAQTYVYFSGTELVPRDPSHAGGWDYDPATKVLTLYGNECARLQSHAVTDVRVIFGCPTPPIQ